MKLPRRVAETIREQVSELRHDGNAVIQAWPERHAEPAAQVHRLWGLKTAWVGQTRLRWYKCRHCTGGAQLLHGTEGWGKIPVEFRREMPDETGPKQANVRKCPHCRGTGGNWAADSGS